MRYYFIKSQGMTLPNGSIRYLSPGPWHSLAAVGNCPCADGKRRMVYATSEPDTFFSIPAATRVKGRWVSGYLTMADNLRSSEGYEFRHYKHNKNGTLIDDSGEPDMRVSQDFVRRFMSYEKTPAQWLKLRYHTDFLD